MVNRYRQGLIAISGDKMINQPTIVPTEGTVGVGASAPAAAPYFSIKVENTGSAVAKAVLFDSSQGYQLQNNYVMPLGIVITGLSDNYQFLLNDMAHVAANVDVMKMTVTPSNTAPAQFARSIEVYETLRGSKPHLVKTLFPEMGLSEQQFQSNIVTFPADFNITNRTAIVLDIEPGAVITFGFYQTAEIGRKQ
jgi:hypothetical protein